MPNNKYNIGDTVYFVESQRIIREVKIIKEPLNKSKRADWRADFSPDEGEKSQEYFVYFKILSQNMAKNMPSRCVRRFVQRFLYPNPSSSGFCSLVQIPWSGNPAVLTNAGHGDILAAFVGGDAGPEESGLERLRLIRAFFLLCAKTGEGSFGETD